MTSDSVDHAQVTIARIDECDVNIFRIFIEVIIPNGEPKQRYEKDGLIGGLAGRPRLAAHALSSLRPPPRAPPCPQCSPLCERM